jgi:ATP-dependent 26S proteasome regulatory subunit
VQVTTGARVALRNDSYTLHLLLPTKVDPLVSLMKVEKVPDSTYDMIGGLDQQIKEIKEVGIGLAKQKEFRIGILPVSILCPSWVACYTDGEKTQVGVGLAVLECCAS